MTASDLRATLARQDRWALAYFGGWSLYFLIFWSRAIVVNAEGGITAGHVNIWGDWAIHFTMGSAMAYRDLILNANPLIIGSPFKYPFFVNFLSAVLIRVGVPFFQAFTVPSFFFTLFLVWSLFHFFHAALGSPRAAALASFVFLLNGGLGFVQFARDVAASAAPLTTLLAPPRLYSYNPDLGYYWSNVIQSMVIPQRSFQLGFPWTLTVLAAVLRARGLRLMGDASPATSVKRAALLGAFFGFVPVVHTHSFACGALLLFFWTAWDVARSGEERRNCLAWWGVFYGGTLLVSVPIVLRFFLGSSAFPVFLWKPGWYGTDGSWLLFWARNWGPTLVAALAGLAVLAARAKERRGEIVGFALPFLALFALSNLFVFHAWLWDNTKVIVWSSVGLSALAAVSAVSLWSIPGKLRLLSRSASVVLAVAMCLTGAIDVYRILIPSLNRDEMYSNEDLFLADWTRKNTPAESVWLTGDDHRNWLFNLAGRQAVETFIGWLWTHGYHYQDVDNDIKALYADPMRDDLFAKYGIDYILIGRYETEAMTVDRQGFDRRFPVVMRTDNYTIYKYTKDGPTASVRQATLPIRLPKAGALTPGLVRRAYLGKYFYGKPLKKDDDSDINFSYGADDKKPFPVPGSVEWEGFLRIPEERRYGFFVESDDGAWLYLDGLLVVDNGGSHATQTAQGFAILSKGYHHFRLRYFDAGGGAALHLRWASTGGATLETEGFFH